MNEEDKILLAVFGVIIVCAAVWFVREVIKEANTPWEEPKKAKNSEKTTDEQILEELKKANHERKDSNFRLRMLILVILLFLLLKNCGAT